jgi:hypothetical protein
MTGNFSFLAYVDPGTGSLILQMLIAGVVGASVFFRSALGRLFGFFKTGKTVDPKPPGPETKPGPTPGDKP